MDTHWCMPTSPVTDMPYTADELRKLLLLRGGAVHSRNHPIWSLFASQQTKTQQTNCSLGTFHIFLLAIFLTFFRITMSTFGKKQQMPFLPSGRCWPDTSRKVSATRTILAPGRPENYPQTIKETKAKSIFGPTPSCSSFPRIEK